MEQLVDFAQTTLATTITSTATTVTLTSAAGFPSSGTFSILIDSEIMTVTAVAGTILTVTRNEFGGAASHSSGATVTAVMTARVFQQFRSDNVQSNNYASRPAASAQGILYFSTDTPYIFRDNGSAWTAFGPLYKFTPPDLTAFTWTNQGSTTTDTTHGYLSITGQGTSGDNWSQLLQAIPGGSSWSITAFIIPTLPGDINQIALVLKESSSGKLVNLEFQRNLSISHIEVDYWNSLTSWNSTPARLNVADIFGGNLNWIRIRIVSSTIYFEFSADGYTWETLYSAAINAWFGTGPSHVGFGINANNGTSLPTAAILHCIIG